MQTLRTLKYILVFLTTLSGSGEGVASELLDLSLCEVEVSYEMMSNVFPGSHRVLWFCQDLCLPLGQQWYRCLRTRAPP